jgi:hypothetical protein
MRPAGQENDLNTVLPLLGDFDILLVDSLYQQETFSEIFRFPQ